MHILHPYTHDARFTLEADLSVNEGELSFEFALTAPKGLFELPSSSGNWRSDQIARRLGLWESTCFEAFLQPLGMERYYEFNFSFQPAWNAFEFESYRHPEGLIETQDFLMEHLEWVAPQNRMRVVVKNFSPYRKFRVGLTSVLQETGKNMHYCSIAHKGAKPDFHLADNFTLVRGV